MEKIEFTKTRRSKCENADRLMVTDALFDREYPLMVGIDPGVNFGITFLHGTSATVYHGVLKRETKPGLYALRAYQLLKELVLPNNHITCIVEGAAYNKHFGQVGLSEIRTGFFLSAVMLQFNTEIVPPATIRKQVFGNHLQQAGDRWVQLNHNAADSLSMALYGAINVN